MKTNRLQKTNQTGLGALLVGVCLLLTSQTATLRASDWVKGDVFVAVGNGRYKVYSNAGVLKETLNDGVVVEGPGGFTTGCAFNAAFNLYTTNFSNTKVIKFAATDPHTKQQTIDTAVISPEGHSESIVFAANGDFYVGHPDGNHFIHRYNSAGVFQQSYAVATEEGGRGSDWIDLAADQKTIFYTSEGRKIKRFDVSGAGSQLADFVTLSGENVAFALRLLPPFDGTGGLLVADSSNIKRLNGSGTVIKTYDATNEDFWFALSLDPNGTSFWAGDAFSGNFYRFNIDSGAIELGPISAASLSFEGTTALGGICVKGAPTAGAGVVQFFEQGTNEQRFDFKDAQGNVNNSLVVRLPHIPAGEKPALTIAAIPISQTELSTRLGPQFFGSQGILYGANPASSPNTAPTAPYFYRLNPSSEAQLGSPVLIRSKHFGTYSNPNCIAMLRAPGQPPPIGLHTFTEDETVRILASDPNDPDPGSDGMADSGSDVILVCRNTTAFIAGFLPPFQEGRTFNSNQTLPLKFQLKDASTGQLLSDAQAMQYVATLVVRNISNTSQSAQPTVTPNVFRYDASTHTFIFNLQFKGNGFVPGQYQFRVDAQSLTTANTFPSRGGMFFIQ